MVDQTDLIVDYEKITAMVGERYRSWEGWISLDKCVDRRSRSFATMPHQRPPWQQKITFPDEKSLDSHIHVRVVYLLKTRRTRSSIKLRPTKVSLFYRDLQVSLRPCRQERSMWWGRLYLPLAWAVYLSAWRGSFAWRLRRRSIILHFHSSALVTNTPLLPLYLTVLNKL